MRELKFRAWHERYGMSKPFSVGGCPIFDFVSRLIDWESEVVVEQFTGLHDKDGVEIYEGDLVNARYGNGSVTIDKIPRKVAMGVGFDSDGWANEEWLGWVAGHTSLLDIHEYCSVIGNVHDNPERLSMVEVNE